MINMLTQYWAVVGDFIVFRSQVGSKLNQKMIEYICHQLVKLLLFENMNSLSLLIFHKNSDG